MPMARKIQVLPSGAPLGAEIVGVDLSEEIDDQTSQVIDAASIEFCISNQTVVTVEMGAWMPG